MIVLSLGAGVQSTTVLLLSEAGILPRIDHAIFADTGWEPQAVYDNLEWLKTQTTIPVHTVSAGNVREGMLNSTIRGPKIERHASMPLRVIARDGSEGMIRRQCTPEYKIEPIEKHIRRELLGVKFRQRVPKGICVDHWFGISSDESHRMAPSRSYWQRNCYPLVNMPERYLERSWSRSSCLQWLAEKYPGRTVPRSACIGCPFHSDTEWAALTPDDLADAVEFDHAIRHQRLLDGEAFVHRSCKPLADVKLGTDQIGLWGEECGGHCGL